MLDANGKRMLAYVQEVVDVEPLFLGTYSTNEETGEKVFCPQLDENGNKIYAEAIEKAHVLGWTLIVKKSEFKPGDKCVFFEIDSKVPAGKFFNAEGQDVFEFLAQKHYEIKTYKLNKFGVWGQGLILPLSAFNIDSNIALNTDLTEFLGVTYSIKEDNFRKSSGKSKEQAKKQFISKHKKFFSNGFIKWLMKFRFFRWLFLLPMNKGRKDMKKAFPSEFVSKTDEERCLVGDTKILTNKGKLRIADIVNKKLDVEVLSYNESTCEFEYKPIVSTQKFELKEDLIKIKFGKRNKPVICTNDHKFLTFNRGYVEAEDLSINDKLMRFADSALQMHSTLDSISSIETLKKSKFKKYVYDLTVADNHNFIANGIVTHNCQNMPYILEDKQPLIATEKIDGTSTTWLMVRKPFGKFEFYVCSRNVRMFKPDQECYNGEDNIYWENAIKYDIENQFKKYLKAHKELKWVCIQGESYGEGWQGNPLKLKGHHFAAFNFKDSQRGRWGSIEAKELLESWDTPIPWVPILDTAFVLPDTVEELLNIATAKSTINPNVLREGIVFRSRDGQLSFKAVSPEYLLKHNL